MRESRIDFLTAWPSLLEIFSQSTPVLVDPVTMAVIVAAAIVLTVPRASWRWFGLFTTLVHELGHAFAAALTGRRVTAIHIRADQSGSAHSLGRPGFSAVFSGFFGYPAPALVGFALLWAVFNGFTAAALVLGGVIIILTLLFIRNLFGVLVVLGSAAVSFCLWYFGTLEQQGFAMLALGVALLVGAVRGLFTVISVHTSHRDRLESSDAYLLARRSGVPSFIWLLAFTAVILGSAWASVSTWLATLS
jgi:hypothetical protein